MSFSASPQERSVGFFAQEKVDAILEQIGEQGFAVVENLVSAETCELLGASIVEDVQVVRAKGKVTDHEKATGQGHLQLGLRRRAPYVRKDLIANPLVEHLVSAVLGHGAWLGFYNGNVNLPGSVHQPLHFDRPFSWRTKELARVDGQHWPPPTTTLSCSVALTDITVANGATQIYPGTHRETAVTQWPLGERLSNHPELVERWGPPGDMPIPAGGVCFRDPRMWHRGVPNLSDQVRPMIALTYHALQCRNWRGRLAKNLDPAVIEKCQRDPRLKIMDDGQLADGRLVFEDNVRPLMESIPSSHQINRNMRFVDTGYYVDHFLGAHLVGGASVGARIADSPSSPPG